MSLISGNPNNNPSALVNIARRPTVIVKLDGKVLNGVVEARTSNFAHNDADTFEIELALQTQPSTSNWAHWGQDDIKPEIEVIYGYLDANGNISSQNSVVIGPVDHVEVSQPENKLMISGRDYSQLLMDTQTFQNYTNQTASQIVTKIATDNGLTPAVTATKTPIGRQDEETGAYSRTTRRESNWDLVTTLARNEGFVVFVRGKTLYFQPDTLPTGKPYPLIWTAPSAPGASPSSNVKKLHLSRQLTLAKDITVTVTSHIADHGTSVKATAHSTTGSGKSTGSAKTKPQEYTIDIPGLTLAQCQARAQQLLKTYSLFERVISIQLPGDPLLMLDRPVTLSGTNTSWDQTYYSDRINRRISMSGGFIMDIRAKNHSPTQTQSLSTGSAT